MASTINTDTKPIVIIRDDDHSDEYLYLAEGSPGMALDEAIERVSAAIRAAKARPADPDTGYTFEDLERELAAHNVRLVPCYGRAAERW